MKSSGARLASLIGAMLFSAVLYFGTLGNPPLPDDRYYLLDQPFLQKSGNLLKVISPRAFLWVLPERNSARPTWLASVLIDRWLYEDDFMGYRLTNILWHGLGAVLLMLLAWQLTQSHAAAAMAGMLFTAHPLHTEPVNVVTFRADVLAFAFMTLSLSLYWSARGRPGPARARLLGASLVSYVLALFAKEAAAILPLLIATADRLLPEKTGRRRPWAVYAAFLAVLLLYLLFRIPRSGYVMGSAGSDERAVVNDIFSQWREHSPWLQIPADPRSPAVPTAPAPRWPNDPLPWRRVYEEPGLRLRTMAAVLGDNLRLLVWPHPLRGDYAPELVESWKDFRLLGSWAAWLALFAAAWLSRKRQPVVSLGLLWIPIAMLPVSGIVSIPNLQAERFLYIPSAGLCLAAGQTLSLLGRRAKIETLILFLILILGLSLKTADRNEDYGDEVAYFQATLAADPRVPRTHFNLARALAARGRSTEAESEFRTATRLWPEFTYGRAALGKFLLAQGRGEEAVAELKSALRDSPDNALLHYTLGLAHWSLGRPSRALPHFQSAARLHSGFWQAELSAGVILLDEKKPREALEPLEKAWTASANRSSLALYHLALAHRLVGKKKSAKRFQDLLERTAPDLARAYRAPRVQVARLLPWPSEPNP